MNLAQYKSKVAELQSKLQPLLVTVASLNQNIPEAEGLGEPLPEIVTNWNSTFALLDLRSKEFISRAISYSKSQGSQDPFEKSLKSLLIILKEIVEGIDDGSVEEPYLKASLDAIDGAVDKGSNWLPKGVTQAQLDEAVIQSNPEPIAPIPPETEPTPGTPEPLDPVVEAKIKDFISIISATLPILSSKQGEMNTKLNSIKENIDKVGHLLTECGNAISLVVSAINKGTDYLTTMEGVMALGSKLDPNIGTTSGYAYAKDKILKIEAGELTKSDAVGKVFEDIPPTLDYKNRMIVLQNNIL
ncbi:hypothetical protein [Vibrio phage Va2]|nr:hypothetical protein [Vibrio phage Va2]